MQLLVIMVVIGFIGHEVISVAVTAVNLEEDARDVAVAARDAYRDRGAAAAEDAARATAGELGVTLVSVEADDVSVSATVTKQADTFVAHRIGPLEDLTTPTSTRRVPRRP